jgi:hypothetical protein
MKVNIQTSMEELPDLLDFLASRNAEITVTTTNTETDGSLLKPETLALVQAKATQRIQGYVTEFLAGEIKLRPLVRAGPTPGRRLRLCPSWEGCREPAAAGERCGRSRVRPRLVRARRQYVWGALAARVRCGGEGGASARSGGRPDRPRRVVPSKGGPTGPCVV